ncbi:DUF6036 family nucleotidyltransferase [Haloferula sp. A504]|uniref:DUF6036 family nucleotidyltransferase n=1 Tax=Haloferula sp. A504 TaxID=3373601 RepID=UPI0031C571BE|nr:hypothetical protein [Verrucomicrobiaceae bacterium E54]
MTLEALKHLLRSATALADDRRFLVLGSASLLATFPDLGDADSILATTYDADLCPEPFDELTGIMLDEALGENRAYFRRHGYHADILRDSILNTLPTGWRERLVTIPDCPTALALEVNDLAAVKLLVGRPKDLELIRQLHESGRITAGTVRERIDALEISVELKPRLLANFKSAME